MTKLAQILQDTAVKVDEKMIYLERRIKTLEIKLQAVKDLAYEVAKIDSTTPSLRLVRQCLDISVT